MNKILHYVNEKYDGKYDYLRISKVDILEAHKKIFLTFLMPQDIYDFSFNNSNIKEIKDAINEKLQGYELCCRFEKIILEKENVKGALIDYLDRHFPLVSANTDYSAVIIEVGDIVNISFSVQNNIFSYIKKVSFDSSVKAFIKDKLSVDVNIKYDIIEDAPIAPTANSVSRRYSTSIPIDNKQVLHGREKDIFTLPVHIASIKTDGSEAVACGKTSNVRFNKRGEDKRVEGKRFYEYYYTFSISDTTGYLNVFINTNAEISKLINGIDVVVKGRISQKDSRNFSMYCVCLATCTIDYQVIKEQTKPLPPPEAYSLLTPKLYTKHSYDQMRLLEDAPLKINKAISYMCAAVRTVKSERSEVPYEIAFVNVENGEIKEYIHSYLKAVLPENGAFTDEIINRVFAAPRLSAVLPDLLRFCAGKTIVAANPAHIIEMLNGVGKPLRYFFANETRQLSSLLNKKSKKDEIAVESAFDQALTIAEAVILA